MNSGKVLKGTGVVVINQYGDYLIIRRVDSNELGLVGGGFDGEESHVACAHRELQEEVGITVDIENLEFIGTCESPPNPFKQDSVNGLSVNYVVFLNTDEEGFAAFRVSTKEIFQTSTKTVTKNTITF